MVATPLSQKLQWKSKPGVQHAVATPRSLHSPCSKQNRVFAQNIGTTMNLQHSVCDTLAQMRHTATCHYPVAIAVVALSLTTLSLCSQSSAQSTVGNCKPVSERTTEVGCWIIAHQPIGQLTGQTFWHLDVYPTRSAAEAARGPRGIVVESLGKVWLLTVEKAGWRPSQGERIAEIGPLPVVAGEEYSAQYMEAILNPGMTSSLHMHAGPEAWYTLAGETCLETPERKYVGRAGGEPVIVPGGPPMLLTATGAKQRRALVLILHQSSKPPTTLVHDWTPKGLCK
jgi:quercetin dioxygenase-like cupin family protein